MSAVLDRRFPGGDDGYINLSPDGKWIIDRSSRMGCQDNPCVSVFSIDGTVGRKVRGGTVNADAFAAVGNGGNIVVYPERNDDGSREDLKVSRLVGSTWSAPRTITSRSPGPINTSPAISTDGRRVVHDCGRVREPSEGSISICESRTDGSGTTNARPRDAEAQEPGPSVSVPAPPGLPGERGIVFEANWAPHGESLWFVPPRSKAPRKMRGATGNNVAPCGLPDGRVGQPRPHAARRIRRPRADDRLDDQTRAHVRPPPIRGRPRRGDRLRAVTRR